MRENGKVGLRYSIGGGKHGLNEKEFSNVAEEEAKVLRKISYAMLDFNTLEIAKIKWLAVLLNKQPITFKWLLRHFTWDEL